MKSCPRLSSALLHVPHCVRYPLFLGQLFSLFLSPCERKQFLSQTSHLWRGICMFPGCQHLVFSLSSTAWGPGSPLELMEGLLYCSDSSLIPWAALFPPLFSEPRLSDVSPNLGKRQRNVESQRRDHQRKDYCLSSLQWETDTSSAAILVPSSFSHSSQNAPLLHSCCP